MLHSVSVSPYQAELNAQAKARRARMNARGVAVAPPPVVKRVAVDFNTTDAIRLKSAKAQRSRHESLRAHYEQKKLVRWCRGEIWRCKQAVKVYGRRVSRLNHSRELDEFLSEKATRIVKEVMQKYDLTERELLARPDGPYQFATGVVRPIQEASWRIRRDTRLPYRKIGAILGGRDHSTILKGIQRFQRMIDEGVVERPPPDMG